jgi:RNA polymerase sigma-70 factor, ECF subfamily
MNLSKKEISKIIAGEKIALLVFYKKIRPYLERFFLSKVANHKDRDELIADTIISIIDSLPQFQYKSKFSTWMYAVARHELIDYYRRKKIKNLIFSHFPWLENIISKALGPQLILLEKEKKQDIYRALKKLNEGYGEILRLRYLEGLSVSQIANKLEISYKAAESRLSRARLAFRKVFV